ncbi:hypothetical protein ACIBVL_04580 [Streptomyces sp. NPDC049687]|uniref:hypothetical protein n=1 Tax=Streptomyces sp. NPDC049687 TaxID=3365596 RepID=UPI003793FCAE
MSGEQHVYVDDEFEEQVRELLARDADAVRPVPAPYPAIRRRGVAERRRRTAVAGATLLALTAVPVGAYAWAGGSGTEGSVTAAEPKPSVSAPRTPAASAAASGPGRPATDGQLLDGITFTEAAKALKQCLATEHVSSLMGGDQGNVDNYRIILAAKSTGDSNTPGDGIHVVGVSDRPAGFRVICNVKDGVSAGISTSASGAEGPDAGPVVPDANGGDLYQQSIIDKGKWKLPFRWGMIGTVDPSVAKVTVSYGDSSADPAVLDHGWFVAAGVLNQQVVLAPHVKGYDAAGKLVYDSDDDKTYDRTLP